MTSFCVCFCVPNACVTQLFSALRHKFTSVCSRICSIRDVHKTVAPLHQGAPGQMTWLEDPPLWLPPCLLLCFASVSVNRKFKNTISDRFICFILTVKQSQRRWRPLCVLRATTKKKVVNFFQEKSASGWSGSRMFWPRNDLAPLLRCRSHCHKNLY